MWVRPGSFPGAAAAGRTLRPPTISISYDHEHSDETFCEVNKSSTSAIADTESSQAKATKPETRSRKWLERVKSFAPLLALLVLSLLIGLRNPRFFDFFNFVRIANSAAIPLVLALGATFVILLGSVALSVEGIRALGAVVVAVLVRNDMNQNSFGWTAPIFAIMAGAAIGFLNGFVHVRVRIPSFMVTLGSWFVGIGLATLILGGRNARVLDPEIRSLALTRFFNFPLAVWVALGVLVAAWLIERFTIFGRHVLIIAVLGNGMILLGISPDIQQAVQGIIIIIAVASSIDRQRMKFVK